MGNTKRSRKTITRIRTMIANLAVSLAERAVRMRLLVSKSKIVTSTITQRLALPLVLLALPELTPILEIVTTTTVVTQQPTDTKTLLLKTPTRMKSKAASLVLFSTGEARMIPTVLRIMIRTSIITPRLALLWLLLVQAVLMLLRGTDMMTTTTVMTQRLVHTKTPLQPSTPPCTPLLVSTLLGTTAPRTLLLVELFRSPTDRRTLTTTEALDLPLVLPPVLPLVSALVLLLRTMVVATMTDLLLSQCQATITRATIRMLRLSHTSSRVLSTFKV
jgi:hypothetical protein